MSEITEAAGAGVTSRSVSPGIVELRLERARVRNALRLEDKRLLADLVLGAQALPGARAIVITGGDSSSFCAGTDIKEMSGLSVEDGVRMLKTEAAVYHAVMSSPLPVIAAVRGAAFGAGCVLACCCDLVVAGESAVFAMPEVRNGVPAPVQAALIPQIVGLGVAKSMLYRLRRLDSRVAERCGLVHEVVPDDDLYERTIAVAKEMMALPAETFALQKEIVGAWIRAPFDIAVDSSVYVAASAFAGPIPQQAIDAFLQSRHDARPSAHDESSR